MTHNPGQLTSLSSLEAKAFSTSTYNKKDRCEVKDLKGTDDHIYIFIMRDIASWQQGVPARSAIVAKVCSSSRVTDKARWCRYSKSEIVFLSSKLRRASSPFTSLSKLFFLFSFSATMIAFLSLLRAVSSGSSDIHQHEAGHKRRPDRFWNKLISIYY